MTHVIKNVQKTKWYYTLFAQFWAKSFLIVLHPRNDRNIWTHSPTGPFDKTSKETTALIGDCLSPLIFNMVINTFIQYVKSDKFTQLGYSISKFLNPKHWFQVAELQMSPIVQHNESFNYLGRYFNYAMDNSDHKHESLSETERLLEKIDLLPLHSRFKLELYGRHILSKISWHLTIGDINITCMVKQTLDMICHNKFRSWLETPTNGTLDIRLQAKSKFGLNIIDISTKHTQC